MDGYILKLVSSVWSLLVPLAWKWKAVIGILGETNGNTEPYFSVDPRGKDGLELSGFQAENPIWIQPPL